MNHDQVLGEQLEQLGRELSGDSRLPQCVLSRIREKYQDRKTVPTSLKKARARRPRWQAPLAAAATVFVCLGVWWLSRPANLYAQMLAALAEVKTLHVTGWTRHIPRKWPLEGTPTKNLADRWPDGKYPIEMWHWTDPDGTTRSYERAGPVVLVRRGGNSKEYQEDADLTWIYEGGYVKDRVEEYGGMAQYFAALERPSLKKEDLGTRQEAGRRLRGLRLTEGHRIQEIWIDEQVSLPVRLSLKQRDSGLTVMELEFKADEPVPSAIATYTPPATRHVRYGGGSRTNEAWLQHVAELAARLQSQPLSGRIALWPRTEGRLFANQWPLLTSDGKYWIRPIDVDEYAPMTMADFVRKCAATEVGERRHGTWRLPKEFRDVKLPRADLVYGAEVPWEDWIQFVLGQHGLEFVNRVEDRRFWIAKHDGRQLKPWQEVKPPVPYVIEGGVEKKGLVRPGIGFTLHPATMSGLIADFNRMIDRELAADKPLIVDETGLPTPPPFDANRHGTHREYSKKVLPKFYVATDSPCFVGHESVEMARDWYEKEFAITFKEEVRPVTVHVIRRKG